MLVCNVKDTIELLSKLEITQTRYRVYHSLRLKACFILWSKDTDAFDLCYQVFCYVTQDLTCNITMNDINRYGEHRVLGPETWTSSIICKLFFCCTKTKQIKVYLHEIFCHLGSYKIQY